jgi:hypothetical protein
VTSKLETDLERMWKETVMAEFYILSRIFLRTVQVKINKIILVVIREMRFELWASRTRGITAPSVPQS